MGILKGLTNEKILAKI